MLQSFRYVWLTGKYSLWNQKSSYSTDPQSLHVSINILFHFKINIYIYKFVRKNPKVISNL